MTTNHPFAQQTPIWREFCIDVLADRPTNIKALDIDTESVDKFIQFLQMHGLEALLLDLVEQHSKSGLLPKAIRERLNTLRRTAYIKEIYRKQHLEKLLALLNSNNIECLILKGTALAYSLYQHPYQRSRFDTDILIRLEDKDKIDQLLIKTGFSKSTTISGEFVSHQNTYRQAESGINHAYDIHWRITNRNAYAKLFDFDQLFSEKSKLTSLAHSGFKLNNIDGFLHATVHYYGHRSGERDRLIWIYDFHLLCSQFSNQHWQSLLKSSKQKELDPLCKKILTTCKNTFSTQIPLDVIKELSESQSELSKIEYKRIYSSQWSRIDQFKSDWAALTFLQRCRLVKEYLFPPAKFILEQQHSSNKLLLPYFYIKRIMTGIVKIFMK